MQEYCSCGAKLPDDARFCHKCGKPQREEDLERLDAAPPAPEPIYIASSPEPLPELRPAEIGFRNSTAVRIALTTGIFGFFIWSLAGQISPAGAFLWLIAAGFLSVFIYQRRTGENLTLLSGARMGWITGICFFVMATIFVTIAAVAVADEGQASQLRSLLTQNGVSEINAKELLDVFRTPGGLAGILGMFFVVFTLLPTAGGVLGAKLLAKPSRG